MNRSGNRRWNRAPWTLALLTTVCAELTFTAVAVPFTWLLVPLLMVMYGAGVLVLREATVRAGGTWPSLVLLGVAYQVAEDGLGLQALTSPRMYGAADWGFRALGVNWTYWESQVGVHVVLSVLVPITLTDLLFPAQRDRPYLGNRGLAGAGSLAVLGVLGLRHLISATEDPGYRTPWGFTLLFLALIATLGVVALVVLPRRGVTARVRGARKTPHPTLVGVVSGYLTMAFLTTLLPLGLGPTMLLGDLMSPAQRLVVGLMTAGPFGWLLLRWQASPGWSDRHRIRLIGGILVSHTAFMMPASPTAALVGSVAIVTQVYLLARLAEHLRRRTAAAADPRDEHPLSRPE